jgi:hypothetical protein
VTNLPYEEACLIHWLARVCGPLSKVFRDTIGRPLIRNVWWHLIILVLVANMQDGIFKDDENWALLCWYEVNCSLLLINLLAWVLKRLNLGCLCCYSWPVDLSVHFLWVSASTRDPSCGTCLISNHGQA